MWSLQNVAFGLLGWGKQGTQSKGQYLKLITPLLLRSCEKPGVKRERTELSIFFNAWAGDTFGEARWGNVSLSMLSG